ncbi:hypothetical protein Hypma_010257 [Hypsizygus marmoreus]|uniref:BTB domain-containing protein n=1 Tax=Hypsizygus marmoreus TaxID=39966 RepID=A0A369JN61_HYPMA|nr:hypothetical protein Hypma_010257 [Hypsizygus marmoreus]
MEHADWNSVLQYVTDPMDMECNDRTEYLKQNDNPQVPTPPLSLDGSPIVDEQVEADTLVSVSTTFYPGAQHHSMPPDVILLSSDNVFFYVHSHLLLGASENEFHALLPPSAPSSPKDQDAIVGVSDSSTVLNIILHTIYEMSCAHYSPTFSNLCSAVTRLPFYGIRPNTRIVPSSPLYTVLLSHAPLCPLELYALAASFDLYELAVATSSHLLSFPLSNLTDEMADAIGPVYLKRLFFLHFGRSDALKRVLLPPPHPHAPTQWCDFSDQKKLTRAWALASAYLAWDARPDLSTSTMESALRPLEEHLGCDDCKHALRERIKNLVVQWSIVKRTI